MNNVTGLDLSETVMDNRHNRSWCGQTTLDIWKKLEFAFKERETPDFLPTVFSIINTCLGPGE
jgi:hypothetical protein